MLADRKSVDRLASVAHGASLIVGGAILFYVNRRQWFFGDDWDFLVRRTAGDLHDLFAPHNEHWSTIPILVYRAIFAVVGVRSYVPYVAVLVVLHLLVAHGSWRLLLQMGIDRVLATMLVAVVVVLGSGSENLLWAFQIGFVGSVLTGVVMLLLVNHDGSWSRRDSAAVLIAIIGLTVSGVTVSMVIAAAVCILFRRSWRHAFAFALPPALVYAGWLALIGRSGLSTHPRTADSLFQLPQYVWRGLSTGIESTIGLAGAGAVLFLVSIAFLLRHDGFAGLPAAPAVAGMAGAFAMFVIAGFGRAALGLEQASSSRYVYIEVILLLPAFAAGMQALCGSSRARVAALALPLGLVLLGNLGMLRSSAKSESSRELATRGQILATADLLRAGQPVVDKLVEPIYTPDLTVDRLRRLMRNDDLPTALVSPEDRLRASAQLQFKIEPANATDRPTGTADMIGLIDATRNSGDAGCSIFLGTGPSPQIMLSVPTAATLVLNAPSNAEIVLTLRTETAVAVRPRAMIAPAGRSRLVIAAADARPILSLSRTPLQICGISG